MLYDVSWLRNTVFSYFLQLSQNKSVINKYLFFSLFLSRKLRVTAAKINKCYTGTNADQSLDQRMKIEGQKPEKSSFIIFSTEKE